MESFRVIGKSFPRRESFAKATGQARYTDDIDLPGMVYGAILRSSHAHARVLRIDTSEAEKVRGFSPSFSPGTCPDASSTVRATRLLPS